MAGKKGFFVLFGSPGGGKSTEGAACFQGSVYLKSSPNVLQFYEEWLKGPAGGQSGKRMPHREITLDSYYVQDNWAKDQAGQLVPPQIQFDANGMPIPMPQASTLLGLSHQVMTGALQSIATGQPLTYHNLVIDEAGTFLQRVFAEHVAASVTREGKIDTREAYGATAKWTREWTDLLRQILITGMNVVMIAHDTEPDPAAGKKGGPKLPSKPIMAQLCADADGVLLRTLEDRAIGQPSSRIWKAHASQHWLSKLRGLPDSMFNEIKDWPLERILSTSGFAPNAG